MRRGFEGHESMALTGVPGDDTLHKGVNDVAQANVNWHGLFAAYGELPAVHIGPAGTGVNSATAWADGTPKPGAPVMITADTPITADMDSPPAGWFHLAADGTTLPSAPADDAAASAGLQLAGAAWQAQNFHIVPITDPLIDGAVTPPGDGGSASGVLPAAGALIWSGAAIMEFPSADSHGPGDAPAGLPGGADLSDILSHADLDPVLASMGTGGESDALFDPGHGDLSAAFLPPDDPDTSLFGFDAGMLYTPPPLPPPPDFI
jgi:hypothetical protein